MQIRRHWSNSFKCKKKKEIPNIKAFFKVYMKIALSDIKRS